MWSRIRPHLSYANVVATLALAIALGAGTAFAASKIDGKTIKKASVPGNRLKSDSVTGKQVKESSLSQVPSAASAASSDTALVGQSPLAWAHVASNGNVIDGRGITNANIVHPPSSALYCIVGEPAFKSLSVTTDLGMSPIFHDLAIGTLKDYGCPAAGAPGTQATVFGVHTDTGAFEEVGFFVQLYN